MAPRILYRCGLQECRKIQIRRRVQDFRVLMESAAFLDEHDRGLVLEKVLRREVVLPSTARPAAEFGEGQALGEARDLEANM